MKFPPLLSKKFDITGIKQDMLKWDKEWEAALASSTAADVLKEISHVMDDSFFTLDDLEFLHLDLRNVQEGAAQSLRKIFHEGHFNTIWLLLDASEQRRHILEGLEKASEAPTLWGQDSRALCPEVTVLNSYQRAGRALSFFLLVSWRSSSRLIQRSYQTRRICQTHGGNRYRMMPIRKRDPKHKDRV